MTLIFSASSLLPTCVMQAKNDYITNFCGNGGGGKEKVRDGGGGGKEGGEGEKLKELAPDLFLYVF